MRTPLSIAVVGLLLMGAGCGASSSTQVNVNASGGASANVNQAANVNASANANVSVNANVNANSNTNMPSGQVRALPAATGVDATWKTYTNAALGFSFQYPTKGSYASEWSVRFLKEGDSRLFSGCDRDTYSPEAPDRQPTAHVSVNGQVFCHSSMGDGFAGGYGLVDTYTTKIGSSYVTIRFEQIVHNPGACVDADPVCARAMAETGAWVRTSSSGARSIFREAEYQAALDNTIATFHIGS